LKLINKIDLDIKANELKISGFLPVQRSKLNLLVWPVIPSIFYIIQYNKLIASTGLYLCTAAVLGICLLTSTEQSIMVHIFKMGQTYDPTKAYLKGV